MVNDKPWGSGYPKILITIPCRSMEELNSKHEEMSRLREIMSRYENSSECHYFFTFPTEKGYGNAVRNSWLKNPWFDVYVHLDNDFAMPPEEVPLLINRVLDGYDVVIGSRFMKESRTDRRIFRGLLSRAYSLSMAKAFNIPIHEFFCGFRAFSGEFVRVVLPETEEHHWGWQPECIVVADRLGLKVTEVPISWNDKNRPTPLKRMPKDIADTLPAFIRLWREWR